MILEWMQLLDYASWWWILPLFGFIWAPKTWTPGELVSAASMNTNIRDHLNESLRTQATVLTGTQNNFALDGPFAYLLCSNASALTLTGALIDSGNVDGAKITIEALVETVTLKHQNANSTSSNRIITTDGLDLVLEVTDRLILIYDGTATRWRADATPRYMVENSLNNVNLLADPTFLIWPAGDAAVPAHWAISGTGAAIARETGTVKVGAMAAKLTYGSAAAYLYQYILPSADYDGYFDGEKFGIGAWIYSDSSDCRIGIQDGSDESWSDAHPGDETWQWLKIPHTIDGAATYISASMKLDSAGYGILCWPSLVWGPIPPPKPLWPRIVRSDLWPMLSGDPVGAGTELWAHSFSRPFIVEDVQIESPSDAAGQAMILDVNHWNGAAWTTMFTTKPEVAVGERSGGEQPDGTYRYRCFTGGFGTGVTNARIGIDCDQAATSGAKNPTVGIRVLSFQRPQELLLGYNSIS
ncbi:MAG: hypothetical protein GY783_02510 [Gammaproteobacteria bacterium]|nr:hypothetical protein [Gammaproteobacteria bacterium]